MSPTLKEFNVLRVTSLYPCRIHYLHAAFTGCHLAERLQSSWKPLSASNDIIRIGALVARWGLRIHRCCCSLGPGSPWEHRGRPVAPWMLPLSLPHGICGGSQPMGTVPPHPPPGCPVPGTADPERCSALSLTGGTTEKQNRLFRSVIFCLRQGATQTDKLQIKRVPHSTPALAVNSPVVQFPALRACQFQLIAGGTKTLCPDSPGSRHP